MWFEREVNEARAIVEGRIRGFLGTRVIIAFAGFVLLISAAAAARPALQMVGSWFHDLLYYRVTNHAEYIEKVGTNEFFSHKIDDRYSAPGKPLHGIVTIQQKIEFDRSECALTIQTTQRSSLARYDDKTSKNVEDVVQDYTQEEWVHLGSVDAIELSKGVKVETVFTDMKRFTGTSEAWHVFISNREAASVRSKTTRAGTNVFPGDTIGNIASFHVISFKPISAFTESLLYLDRWCGNAKIVGPDVEKEDSQ
jgi:hypothetical protein